MIGRSWRGGTKYDCKHDLTRSESIPTRGNKIFCSGVEAKRGVEFRHSKRNASERGKWEREFLNLRFPLLTAVCGIQRDDKRNH